MQIFKLKARYQIIYTKPIRNFFVIFCLQIDYKPILVQKFDTQIEVAVRGWKPVYLRMGGHVEAPCVDIDIVR